MSNLIKNSESAPNNDFLELFSKAVAGQATEEELAKLRKFHDQHKPAMQALGQIMNDDRHELASMLGMTPRQWEEMRSRGAARRAQEKKEKETQE